MTTHTEQQFRRSILKLAAEGQKLTLADKVLINKVVTEFIADYKAATGEIPQAYYGTIYILAPRIRAYGYKLPRVDRWEKEDMDAAKRIVKRLERRKRERT